MIVYKNSILIFLFLDETIYNKYKRFTSLYKIKNGNGYLFFISFTFSMATFFKKM